MILACVCSIYSISIDIETPAFNMDTPAFTDNPRDANRDEYYYGTFTKVLNFNGGFNIYINTSEASNAITDMSYISFLDASTSSSKRSRTNFVLHLSDEDSIELNTIIMEKIPENNHGLSFFKTLLDPVLNLPQNCKTKLFIYNTNLYDYIAHLKSKSDKTELEGKIITYLDSSDNVYISKSV